MKILFIRKTELGRPGAAATHYFPVELSRLGHNVGLLVLPGGDDSGFKDSGVEIFESSPDWLASIKSVIGKFQPDIVHVFIHGGCGLYPVLFKGISNAKFVLDIRSPLLNTGITKLLHRIKNIFEPMCYDAITSHGIESAWTVIGKRHEIHWVPPGVDMLAIPDEGAGKKGGAFPFRLVYIGSLNEERNLELLIDGIQVAIKSGISVCLDIFGSGTNERRLKKKVSDSSLSEHVRFMGSIGRDELFRKLKTYDAGVAHVPNGIFEMAPPLKTVEYLACGLPVLASNTSGNRMFVKEGVNGFFFENNADSFRSALETIVSCPDRQEISHQAVVSVQSFNWHDIVGTRLVPVYQNLLKQ